MKINLTNKFEIRFPCGVMKLINFDDANVCIFWFFGFRRESMQIRLNQSSQKAHTHTFIDQLKNSLDRFYPKIPEPHSIYVFTFELFKEKMVGHGTLAQINSTHNNKNMLLFFDDELFKDI